MIFIGLAIRDESAGENPSKHVTSGGVTPVISSALTSGSRAQKWRKQTKNTFRGGKKKTTINLVSMMNNCQQIMTVAIKKIPKRPSRTQASPEGRDRGAKEAKNKLPVCSHLNATFSCDLCEGRKAL